MCMRLQHSDALQMSAGDQRSGDLMQSRGSEQGECLQVGQSTEEQADGANILGDSILTGGNMTPIAKFSKGDKVRPAHVAQSFDLLPAHDAQQECQQGSSRRLLRRRRGL